jgi:hypothetical protein
MNTREHQVVWVSSSTWVNDVTVTDIHDHEGRLFGYCTIGAVTWLVQHAADPTIPVWVIVGWVRTD